ncbi:MAG: amino acid ABC transporter substrate-binding protein [Eggerthellaceae bacterium]|nr:amino acid ABC transporter substrate-binding protein [Eggerthellaceae bacterium]MBQ3329128.1 amino acid ABC transporter substrate-binding protein [Eggerthellaceae bacterium]
MKASKYIVLAAVAVMVAALALVGCSSGGSSSAASSASGSSASASSASASSTASADKPKLLTEGKLVVATSPDYPPFENLENGEYVGLDIEIAKAVAKELGYEIEFKNLQFDAIIPAIAAGGQADIGISGFSVDPERAKEIDFSDSYYIDDQAIAVMKGGSITKDNADESLNKEDVTIAVQSGTTGESYVKENYPKAKVQPYGNSTDAFAALQSGQANAVCTNLAVVQKMLKDAYQDAEVVKSIATGEEYAIVVSKDNAALKTAINDALKKMKSDGTIDKLIQQYM